MKNPWAIVGLFLYGILISCTPQTDSTVSCGVGETYNSVTQSCLAGALPPNTPRPITNSVTILEDSGKNQVFLEYEDINNNLASDCDIIQISEEINNGSPIPPPCSCVGGICSFVIEPINDFFGISGFTYNISNVYGTGGDRVAQVIVERVNDPPVAITPHDLKPDPRQNQSSTSSLVPLVNDIDDSQFTYEIVGLPTKGTISLNSLTGTYIYFPGNNLTGSDLFTWRAIDPHGAYSNVGTININIIAVDTPPTGSPKTAIADEDVDIEINLPYQDIDGDIPRICVVSEVENLLVIGACNCSNDGCKVTVRGRPHYFTYYQGLAVPQTNASFNYNIFNDFDNTGIYKVTVNINEINDPPLTLSQSVVGPESNSAFPLPFDFTLNGGVDYDNNDGIAINDQILSYSILTLPSMGTLTGCLDRPGSEGMNDLTCTFTPIDGNINGVNSKKAELTHQNIRLEAKWNGNSSDSVTYQLTSGANLGVEYVEVTGNQIKVHIASGQTLASKIASLINSDLYAQNLVSANVDGGDFVQTWMPAPLSLQVPGGSVDFDLFSIDAFDTVVKSYPPHGAIQINIDETEDNPVICQYSRFDQAQECGILGCIGDTMPIGRIKPSKLNQRFYDKASAVCWVSTGFTVNDWAIGPSYIFDQEINEKDIVIVTPTKVDQGGGFFSENSQLLYISNVQSSDHNLIPPSNIEFYFNSQEYKPGQSFGTPGESASNSDFRIRIIPQGGVYGNADVSFDLLDSPGNGKTSVKFNVKVNNVSAKHNGWKNLSAVGPKTNNFGLTLDGIPTCSFTRDKCSLPNGTVDKFYKCVGINDPNGRITSGAKDVIYLNQENGTCWINNISDTNNTWVPFNTFCNVSPLEIATECQSNGSCIFNNEAEIKALTPNHLNSFYYNMEKGECWRSIDTATNINQVQKYTATNEITLEWDYFTTSGVGSVEGYNIYRRLANEKFDYFNPINKQIIELQENKYVDNGVNSIYAPTPKTVYYYEVRPIINEIPTDTSEPFKMVRITSPPDNMVFAHRWIMNVRMCKLLHSENINTLDNFSCPYIAPGEKMGVPGIYDIGQDLLVDRFEAGCSWTLAPVCSGTPDNACIGLADPNTVVSAPADTIYYNRTNGTCYRNIIGDSWLAINGLFGGQIIGAKHRTGQMPPIVNVTQEDADTFCKNTQNSITGILGLTSTTTNLESKLPSRFQQMAYSFYHPDLTDFEISSLETGLSLNATPKCNTSMANGLDNDYSETQVPDSNTFYTLPGSLTSTIRSLITGSDQTKLCQSAFGVQDHVGNVGEFTLERIECSTFSQCPGVLFGEALSLVGEKEDYFTVPSDPTFNFWTMDGVRGPCVDSNADQVCDGVIGKWAIQEQNFGAGRMAIPMSLPIQVDYPTLNPLSPVNPYLLEIGPTNGITADQLHEDSWAFYNQNIWSTSDKCGSMSTGGNFNDSNGAGQFSFEFLTCGADATSYLTLGSEMALRSLDSIPWTLEMKNPNIANGFFNMNVLDNKILINLATNSDSALSTNYLEISSCLNNPSLAGCNCTGNCAQVLETRMFIGLTTSEVASPMNETLLIDTTEEAVNNREDTGFRCLNPIDPSLYLE
ncbi:MAG: hypothetical protein DRQ88_00170 [Epsilonproteobacteria bacterium]|nr:MAG: hypothetical protein DRQ89_06095 [Campylobacterota bacterium]RLA68051.1 MAG: hypothetical protein DRQ88_00170 [Campylobacterota bacterium]